MPYLPKVHRIGTKPKPFSNSRMADKRITGRALQARNDRIKLRDKFRCQMCGRVTEDGEVDHVICLASWGLRQGDPESDANLQWLCRKPCHADKSRREAIEAKRG